MFHFPNDTGLPCWETLGYCFWACCGTNLWEEQKSWGGKRIVKRSRTSTLWLLSSLMVYWDGSMKVSVNEKPRVYIIFLARKRKLSLSFDMAFEKWSQSLRDLLYFFHMGRESHRRQGGSTAGGARIWEELPIWDLGFLWNLAFQSKFGYWECPDLQINGAYLPTLDIQVCISFRWTNGIHVNQDSTLL